MRRLVAIPLLLMIACLLLSLPVLSLPAIAAVDAKADEVIAKSLDSIGTAEARAAVKSRVVQGPLHFKDLDGRLGDETGYWGLVTERHKMNLVMKFGNGEWHGERFVYDGAKTDFAVFTSSHRPSSFGEFIRLQDFVLKEGLLGGELSAAWALDNLDRDRTRVDYAGTKKLDDHELEAIEYHARGNEMEVTMYFDPASHHHVATIYKLTWEPGITRNPNASAGRQAIRYTMEERFGDFQADHDLTLPRHYELRYIQEPSSGASRQFKWDMTAEKIFTNVSADPQNFEIK
jgi:hypothetical protein